MDNRKLFLSFFMIFVIIILYYFNLFNFLENKIYDMLLLFKYLFSKPQVDEVVIVKIDNEFLDEAGNWPIKRSIYAEAIEILNKERVRTIGVDITFASAARDTQEDRRLVEALTKHNNVVLPLEMVFRLVRGINYEEIDVVSVSGPLEEFANRAKTGYINFISDRDGIIRRLLVSINTKKEEYYSFSYQLAVLAGYNTVSELKGKQILLNFLGPSDTIPSLSLKDLLEGSYLPGYFKDKIVLIGVDSSSLGDRYMTPFSRYGYLAGVELHGQALYNIIHGNYIRLLPAKINSVFVIILMVLFAFIFYYFPPVISRNYLCGFFSVLILINIISFYNFNLLLPSATPLIGVGLLYAVNLLGWYLSSERERLRVVELFGRYISEDVIKELIDTKEPIKPGGDQAELSVMFLDIRGFTGYAEDQAPEKIVNELNETFEKVVRIIFKHKGTLDKYLGDGLMAFFGAPLNLPDHYEKCLEAALEIRELDLPFRIGIGINSGTVLVGNIGYTERMDYTIIGDTVNKAFRLVEIAGADEIVIGENTYEGVSKALRKLAWKREQLILKGSKQETVIFRLTKEVE